MDQETLKDHYTGTYSQESGDSAPFILEKVTLQHTQTGYIKERKAVGLDRFSFKCLVLDDKDPIFRRSNRCTSYDYNYGKINCKIHQDPNLLKPSRKFRTPITIKIVFIQKGTTECRFIKVSNLMLK